jgi:hypothetical protein
MSQGPTLVGPQVAFYDVGFSPCGMPSSLSALSWNFSAACLAPEGEFHTVQVHLRDIFQRSESEVTLNLA